jgi:hypothetical protein
MHFANTKDESEHHEIRIMCNIFFRHHHHDDEKKEKRKKKCNEGMGEKIAEKSKMSSGDQSPCQAHCALFQTVSHSLIKLNARRHYQMKKKRVKRGCFRQVSLVICLLLLDGLWRR